MEKKNNLSLIHFIDCYCVLKEYFRSDYNIFNDFNDWFHGH